jgi:hypothetical protein
VRGGGVGLEVRLGSGQRVNRVEQIGLARGARDRSDALV